MPHYTRLDKILTIGTAADRAAFTADPPPGVLGVWYESDTEDLYVWDDPNWIKVGSSSGGTGTVTSVAATVPGFLSISGSPITTAGTLAISYSGTALPIANGGTGLTALGTGVQTWFGTPSSANLAAAITDETGSGALVFASAPTLTNPVVGTQAPGNNTTLAASTAFVTAAIAAAGGGGTVTSVSVVTANGVSGSVATATTTPAITLTLGAITPTSVAASGAVSGSNLSGTNTGDQTITLTGDVTGSGTGSFAATLATVNANVGSFGSATQTTTFTVNGKGLLTAAGQVTVTPAVGSITGLGTGIATWLGTPSSANLAAAITDETGSGALVFASAPTLTNPIVGTQTAGDNSTKAASTAYVDAALTVASPVGRHAVYIAAGSMSPSVTGGCAALAGIASASNQPDIRTLDFDATTQEYAQFSLVMPKSWNEGTLTFIAHWSHAATTTNFGVVWDLQAVAVSNDDGIAVAFGTAQTSTDTGGTTNDLYSSPESSAITVAGTPAAEDMVFFRLSRVTGNGSDTMAIDARLHGVTVYMTTDAGNDA